MQGRTVDHFHPAHCPNLLSKAHQATLKAINSAKPAHTYNAKRHKMANLTPLYLVDLISF
jgi:hypothetical protein